MKEQEEDQDDNQEPSLFDMNTEDLLEDWCKHPKLFHQHAMYVVNFRAELERLKMKLKIVTAELDADIRKEPAKYGMPKATEDSIKHMIVLQHRWQKASEEVIKGQKSLDVMEAAVEGLNNKKKAMEMVVHLVTMDYHATPKAPRGSREAMEDHEKKQALKKIKQRLNEDR